MIGIHDAIAVMADISPEEQAPTIRYWDARIGAWMLAGPGETEATIATKTAHYSVALPAVRQDAEPTSFFVYLG
jgi:hypothetical protein